jgi:hypothetical protein
MPRLPKERADAHLITKNKMKVHCLALVVVGLVAGSLASLGQNPSGQKIAVALLKEDLRKFKSLLEASQIGLYLYTPKDTLDKVFARIDASLDVPMTPIEFHRKVAPLNKYLANLHTIFWPSADYEIGKETGTLRFPLDIYWDDGKMYVLRNNSGIDVPQGSVIRSVNGQNVTVLFQKMLDGVLRDGFNLTYPTTRLSRNFSYYYDVLIGAPEAFEIELTKPDGAQQTIRIPGMTATEIKKSREEKYGRRYSAYGEEWEAWIGEKEPALRLEIKSSTAVLTLRTLRYWTIEANGQKWEDFLSDVFVQLEKKQVTDLIIDMRNNHGGHDVLAMLMMSHLHDSAFNYYRKRSAILKPRGKVMKVGNIYEIEGRGEWTGEVRPAAPMFKGKVYILMNGFCASASGEFIGQLKSKNRATFIGEEAGGNPVIFMGGQTARVDLPNTHMTGFLPFVMVEMNVRMKNTGHGVMPDYQVVPTITEVLGEKDVVIDFAFNLIEKTKK